MTSPTTSSRLTPQLIGFSLFVVSISLVFGLVAGSGNLILVFLITGLLGGIALVAYPTFLLWLGMVWSLAIAGIITYFSDIGHADWLVYAAAAGFWFVAAITFLRNGFGIIKSRSEMPSFLLVFLFFYLITLANSIYNYDGIAQLMVGLKNYLLLFGITLALAVGVYTSKTLHRIALGILFIGLLQLPVALYQYLVVRAQRISTGGFGYADSIIEASDAVVGTMGGQMLHGGLDDVMTLLNFVVMAGVFAAYKQGMLSLIRTTGLTILLAIPVLLAETKVIFVFFPVVVVVVAWESIKKAPHKLILVFLTLPLVIYAGLWGYYQLHWSKQYSSFDQSVTHLFSYSFEKYISPDRAVTGDMSRREAVEYWWDAHNLSTPDKLLLGHGLAQSKYSSAIVIPKTVREHGMRKLAKTGLSQLLWDVGMVGTCLFMAALTLSAKQANRISKIPTIVGIDYVIIKGAQLASILILLSLFYRNSALNAAQSGFILFLTLGVVAFYHSQASSFDFKKSIP